jgi:excisionase family DNA binding protein
MTGVEQHYRVEKVAELLDVSVRTIERAITLGELRSVRFGSCRRVPVSAVEEWAAGRGSRVVPIDRQREKMQTPKRRRTA